IRGALLLGLSRLKDLASPSWVRTYSSVSATAFSRSLFFLTNATHAIEFVDGSYSHRPTKRPRSRIIWLGDSFSVAAHFAPFSVETSREWSAGSSRSINSRPSRLIPSTLAQSV